MAETCTCERCGVKEYAIRNGRLVILYLAKNKQTGLGIMVCAYCLHYLLDCDWIKEAE